MTPNPTALAMAPVATVARWLVDERFSGLNRECCGLAGSFGYEKRALRGFDQSR